MTRRTALVLLAPMLMAALVFAAPPQPADAQLPPPPTILPPPADGNPLADVLGPAVTDTCANVAVVYALLGPIVSANLPPDLQALVAQLDPYLSLATVACGYLVTPPSGFVCAPDQELAAQMGALGIPLALPQPFKVGLETAAGIENAFLRIGIDIGTETSRQLATALGCTIPEPLDVGSAAPLPVPELPDASPEQVVTAPATGGFTGGVGARPRIPAVVPTPAAAAGGGAPTAVATVPAAARPELPFRYPAAFAVPLVLLVAIAVFGRTLAQPVRPARPARDGMGVDR